jgi:hypothetical protein
MDGGYNGEDKKGADWVENKLGWTVEIVTRPRARLLRRKC